MQNFNRIVVMGVSGCGKSSIAAELANQLSMRFVEGDKLHPESNIARMSRGLPLDDEMRRPWIGEITRQLAQTGKEGTIVACSALKYMYREWLREAGRVCFIHIVVPRDILVERMGRRSHFMPVSLLDSQLDTLEALKPDEYGAGFDGTLPIAEIVMRIIRYMQSTAKD